MIFFFLTSFTFGRNVSLPPKLLGIVWNFWIVPLLPFVGLKSETLFSLRSIDLPVYLPKVIQ